MKTAAALLPKPERLAFTEAWLADLDHAYDLEVSRVGIVLGAGVFVVKRGPAIWGRRRWARGFVAIVVFVFAVTLVPPWLLLPVGVIAVILWLIFSPTNPHAEASRPEVH